MKGRYDRRWLYSGLWRFHGRSRQVFLRSPTWSTAVDPTADRVAGEAAETIEMSSLSAALCFLERDSPAQADTLEDGLTELANEPVYEEGAVGSIKSRWDRVGGGAKPDPTTDGDVGGMATPGAGFEPNGSSPASPTVSLLESSLSLVLVLSDDVVGGFQKAFEGVDEGPSSVSGMA